MAFFSNKASAALLLVVSSTTMQVVLGGVVLSEKIMKLTREAAYLSTLAYNEQHPEDDTRDFESFGFYDEEPDQAITAKGLDGYCYAAFRGTTLTWVDWKQNFDPTTHEICVDVGKRQECCTTRNGFFDAYSTNYTAEMEASVRKCAKTCDNKDECVVLTGHSQGGAVAAVAALVLADLNPYVITFGQPTTIDAPCDLATSDRWIRYVNTKSTDSVGIAYDPVPFAPGLGANSFGHMVILGEDDTGVAYIGLDAQDFFSPLNVAGFESHSMVSTTEYPGYLDRIDALMAHGTYPIRNNGYVAGSLCSQDKECQSQECGSETLFTFKRCIGTSCESDDDCVETGRCDSGQCVPKLGTCETCDEDSDCASNYCFLFRCSNEDGLMDNSCICHANENCASGRCEGFAPPICEAKLGVGVGCNEPSDCKSDYCSWYFKCEEKSVWGESLTKRSISIPDEPTSQKQQGVALRITFGVMSAVVLVLTGVYYGIPIFIKMSNGYQRVPSSL